VLKAIQDEQDTQDDSTSQTDTTTNETEEQPVNDNALEGTLLANFTPTTERVTELKTEDLVVGTGAEVVAGGTVTAHYTGALVATGVIFQSSKDTGSPFTSPLANLIEGWQTGIPGMKVGGTRRLIIPAAQAYGSVERPGIPADSDLVFDIELIATE
jgi:peptidylprolyl isomerase